MEESLKHLFSTVNEWLRFVEAKHTALIALNGAAVIGLLQALKDIGNDRITELITYWLIPGLIFAGLISFFSMTQWAISVVSFSRHRRLAAANALYFGYISALKKEDFKDEMLRLGSIQGPVTQLNNLLMDQIHVNARIAFAKQRLFHWAVTITFLTFAACFTVFWITRWFCTCN